jgi:TPP-dependent pyruvate/acetoin dehydrogenase alpha subunit
MKNYSTAVIKKLHKSTLLIRKVEERIIDVYNTDVIKSPVHLSIGQESVAVAACEFLNKKDIISNTYRCHATYLAKGGDLNEMMAELYGKADGCAGGKGGSMHLIDMENGVFGASAIVGTTIPVSTGYALAFKRQAHKGQQPRLMLTMFGDGATEEGCVNESINFSSIHKLPQIFFCENNHLAIHTPIEKRWATHDICKRMESYGLKTYRVTSGDIFDILEVMKEAVVFARDPKNPPVFIECFTYRWKEHVGITEDLNEEYRDLNVHNRWKESDQLKKLASMLDEKDVNQNYQEVDELVDRAVEYAINSPFPKDEELYSYVYAK